MRTVNLPVIVIYNIVESTDSIIELIHALPKACQTNSFAACCCFVAIQPVYFIPISISKYQQERHHLLPQCSCYLTVNILLPIALCCKLLCGESNPAELHLPVSFDPLSPSPCSKVDSLPFCFHLPPPHPLQQQRLLLHSLHHNINTYLPSSSA